MKKFVLVVYAHGDKSYRREIGIPTVNKNKLCKAMLGLDRQLNSDKFYSVIEEIECEGEKCE